MVPQSSAKNFNLVLRLVNGEDFTGTVEFRNIRISEIERRSFPPYSAITAMATTAADPKTVKLIVFNKHLDNDLPVNIKRAGISSARIWTVSAPDLAVIKHTPEAAIERVSGGPVSGINSDGISLTIPARSINALEIKLK